MAERSEGVQFEEEQEHAVNTAKDIRSVVRICIGVCSIDKELWKRGELLRSNLQQRAECAYVQQKVATGAAEKEGPKLLCKASSFLSSPVLLVSRSQVSI